MAVGDQSAHDQKPIAAGGEGMLALVLVQAGLMLCAIVVVWTQACMRFIMSQLFPPSNIARAHMAHQAQHDQQAQQAQHDQLAQQVHHAEQTQQAQHDQEVQQPQQAQQALQTQHDQPAQQAQHGLDVQLQQGQHDLLAQHALQPAGAQLHHLVQQGQPALQMEVSQQSQADQEQIAQEEDVHAEDDYEGSAYDEGEEGNMPWEESDHEDSDDDDVRLMHMLRNSLLQSGTDTWDPHQAHSVQHAQQTESTPHAELPVAVHPHTPQQAGHTLLDTRLLLLSGDYMAQQARIWNAIQQQRMTPSTELAVAALESGNAAALAWSESQAHRALIEVVNVSNPFAAAATVGSSAVHSPVLPTISQVPTPAERVEDDASSSQVPWLAQAINDDAPSSRMSESAEEQSSADACVMCMSAPKNWMCIPCGHVSMCRVCSAEVQRRTRRCPICRRRITCITQVYHV